MSVQIIDKEVDGIIKWFKIKGDDAFEDIIDGWIDSGSGKYFEHVKNYDVVVQAGGYCGIYPRLLSQKFKMVYTFEPDAENFYCLSLNCQNHNIVKAQGALGDTYGLVDVVRRVDSNRGMNVVQPSNHLVGTPVPSYRIDDLGLRSCDMIMLDVEGYEYKILQGAMKTLHKFHPVVVVEDTNPYIEELLKDYGYIKRNESHRDTIYSV